MSQSGENHKLQCHSLSPAVKPPKNETQCCWNYILGYWFPVYAPCHSQRCWPAVSEPVTKVASVPSYRWRWEVRNTRLRYTNRSYTRVFKQGKNRQWYLLGRTNPCWRMGQRETLNQCRCWGLMGRRGAWQGLVPAGAHSTEPCTPICSMWMNQPSLNGASTAFPSGSYLL